MKRSLAILLCVATVVLAAAQVRTVEEVKKSINDLSANLTTYKNAQTKLKPALTNEASKNLAETWYVAGKVEFGLYDKNRVSKAVGNTVDVKVMGKALINGYDYYQKALKLDSVKEVNRDGTPKKDKKTGRPRIKTKYSKEILGHLYSRVVDFGAMGTELYKVKDWENAYRSWDIYYAMVTDSIYIGKKREVPDSVLGATCFFQGLTAVQLKKYREAHRLFERAISRGYEKKTVYDNDLNVLLQLGDSAQVIRLAHKAYQRYGTQDVRYVRLLINDNLKNGNMKQAEEMLDQAILIDSLYATYYTIKGDIVESRSSFMEARPYYLKAVELSPEEYQTNFNVGRGYYMEALQFIKDNPGLDEKNLLKRVEPIYRKALIYLEKAHQLQHNSIDTHSILRDIYYQLSDGENLERLDRCL